MVAAKTAAKKNFFTMELALSVVFSGFDHYSGKAYSKNAWLSSTGSRLRLPECTVLRTRATRTGRLYVTSNYPWSASDPSVTDYIFDRAAECAECPAAFRVIDNRCMIVSKYGGTGSPRMGNSSRMQFVGRGSARNWQV